MSYRLFSSGTANALFGDSPVIHAGEAAAFQDMAALLRRATAIGEELETARAVAMHEARAEGRAALLAERDAYAAERIAAILVRIDRGEAELRADIATLALQALRHILGDLPEEIVTAQLVRNAVARLPVETMDSVAVAPAMAPRIAALLPGELAERIVPDPGLEPGDCIVHARSGRVIAHLDLQLERLAERWQAEGAA